MFSRFSFLIPQPVSSTDTNSLSAIYSYRARTLPDLVCCMALVIILLIIIDTFGSSISTTSRLYGLCTMYSTPGCLWLSHTDEHLPANMLAKSTGCGDSVIMPASRRERNRMSLISLSSDAEFSFISLMNTASSSGECSISKSSENPTTVLSGVRISWLILCRNAFLTVSTS